MDWSEWYDSTGEVNPPEARADHRHTVDELKQLRREQQTKQRLNELLGYPRYRTQPAKGPAQTTGGWFTEGEKAGLFVAGMTMVSGLLLFIFSVSLLVSATIFGIGGVFAAIIGVMSLSRHR